MVRRRVHRFNVSTFAGCFAFRPRPAAAFFFLTSGLLRPFAGTRGAIEWPLPPFCRYLPAARVAGCGPCRALAPQVRSVYRIFRASTVREVLCFARRPGSRARACGCASCQRRRQAVGHRSATPNSRTALRVIVSEDHTAPTVSVAVTYNVGSADERTGRTGFAHLFEHMMFKGSENVGPGEHPTRDLQQRRHR